MNTLGTSVTLGTEGKPVEPGWKVLGIDYKCGIDGIIHFRKTPHWERNNRSNINLSFGSAYAMGCCAAALMSGLTGQINEADKENIACGLWQLVVQPHMLTYYAIASTMQLNYAKTESDNLLAWLMELGLKEVFESPNRNHGPNHMHLMVWDPAVAYEAPGWKKHLWIDNPYNVGVLPLSLKTMSEKERQGVFDKWAAINEEETKAKATLAAEQKENQWNTKIQVVYLVLRNRKTALTQSQSNYLDAILREVGYEKRKDLSTNPAVGSTQGAIRKA